MKKFKRLQAFLLSAILIFSLVFSACGGDTSESSVESVNSSVESSVESSMDSSEEIVATGKFYTLEEAYEKGLLSKEDLQKIADIRNGTLSSPTEKLSDELASEIKEARAKELREQPDTFYPDIEAKDIDLNWFYGFYNNYPVIKIFNGLEIHLGVDYPTTLDIDGVIFHFNHPRIIESLVVYVKNS